MISGYVTEAQALMLKSAQWQAPAGYVARPTRSQRVSESGEDESYLPEEDAMDEVALEQVAAALGEMYQHGQLLAERVRYRATSRWGPFGLAAWSKEQVAAGLAPVGTPAPVFDLDNRRMRVLWQWNSKAGALTLPKGNKRRTTLWVEGPTITGFDLAGALERRIAEARAEFEAGSNPGCLLFPSPRGGYWSTSNFDERVWVPAMAAAEVPYVTFEDRVRFGPNAGSPVTRRLYRFTNHSTRDRFAISALNIWHWDLNALMVTGGWKNTKVIHDRYYGVARGILDALQAASALPR